MRRALAVALALGLAPAAAHGQPAPAAPAAPATPPAPGTPARRIVGVLPAEGGELARAALVGRSAELYEPVADGLQRRAAGGVAPDVRAVVRGGDGTLWALASRAPPFRRGDEGAWHAAPLANKGAVAVAPGAPRFAVGRHVYELDGGKWKRQASAPARVTQIVATGPGSVVLLGDGRALEVQRGGRLAPLDLGLAAGESVDRLLADRGGAIATTSTGRWLRLGGKPARPLVVAAELTGFAVEAASAGPALLVVGWVASPTGGRRYVLARVDGDRLVLVEDVAPPPAGDVFAVVAEGPAGAVLLATEGGQVRRRTGGTWSEIAILADALPARAP